MTKILFLISVLCVMSGDGSNLLFGSPFLFKEFSFPSSPSTGHANRAQYARQYGEKGDLLIEAFGKGHHPGHQIDHGHHHGHQIAQGHPQHHNKQYTRVKRYQSPTLFSQSKPVISRYNPAVYTVYSQTKQAYRPYTSQNQFQPSQLVSNQFNPVYASEKKSEYQAVYTRYVPSSDSFSTNLPSYSSESDTNSFYGQDRSSSIVSPQYTYSVQSTQDNTQNPQTTYTYLSE